MGDFFEIKESKINEYVDLYKNKPRIVRNLEHSHDASQTFGHPKSHTLGQPAKGQS